MLNAVRTVKLIISIILITMLAYIILGSVVPNSGAMPVSAAFVDSFSAGSFFGQGQGPDRAALIETPEDAFNVRLEMILAAQSTIDITTHTIHDDASSRALLAALLQAAQRDVLVTLFVDGTVGIPGGDTGKAIKAMARHQNITVLEYSPLSLLKPSAWHAFFHDKIIMVDGRYLLLGGRNLGDRYFAPQGTKDSLVAYDRDVFVTGLPGAADSVMAQVGEYLSLVQGHCTRLQGGAPGQLAAPEAGLADYLAANPRLCARTLEEYIADTLPTAKVSLIWNPPDPCRTQPLVAYQLGELALEADSRVVIQTPYATANRDVLAALARVTAAEKVYLTNSMATSPNYPAFSDYNARKGRFLQTGFDIYEYQGPGSIHAKSMVVDRRISAVGSFNLDDRSMYLDTETMLVIDSPQFAARLEAAIGALAEKSLPLGPDGAYLGGAAAPAPVPFGKKALMGIVSVFSGLFRFLI